MNQYGDGIEKNITRAMRYYNQSINYEQNAFYPTLIMKYYMLFETSNFIELFTTGIESIFIKIASPGWILYSLISFIIFYIVFFLSLYFQKD